MNFDENHRFSNRGVKFFSKKNRIAQKYHFLPYLCDNHAVWTFGTTKTEKSDSGPDFGRFPDMDGSTNPGNHCSTGEMPHRAEK